MLPFKRSITLESVDDDPRIPDALEKLKGFMADYGLSVSDDQLLLCIKHLLYVLQVNDYINLTSIKDFDKGLVLHILDSLLLLPYVSADSEQLILDMGTGAGFPGIPLAIASNNSVGMLDSVGKKVNAVNAFGSALSLSNASAVHERIESFGFSHRASFDIVVARALASLPVLLEYARPLLKIGGRFILTKGSPEDCELRSGEQVARMLGYRLLDSSHISLPASLGDRTIMVYEAYKPSSVKLPRQVGVARKNPLA